MLNISTIIEKYIKEIFQKNNVSTIEVGRNELADKFDCAPSQISYVMQTRFNLEKGYIVQSKRGGGGYIRIQKIDLPKQNYLHLTITEFIGDEISLEKSLGIIQRLYDEQLITKREKLMLQIAISQDALDLDYDFKNKIRAELLSSMLTAILGKELP